MNNERINAAGILLALAAYMSVYFFIVFYHEQHWDISFLFAAFWTICGGIVAIGGLLLAALLVNTIGGAVETIVTGNKPRFFPLFMSVEPQINDFSYHAEDDDQSYA